MAKGITEEEVHQAADALLAEGVRPTIERLRQKLGRGSPNTVNRYVDTWWKGLSDRMRGSAKGNMPVEVVRLAGRLWAAALEHAKRQIEGQPRSEVPTALDALQRQLAELRQTLGHASTASAGGAAPGGRRRTHRRPLRSPRRKRSQSRSG